MRTQLVLHNLKYGVGIARRGWITRGEVLNTQGGVRKAVRPANTIEPNRLQSVR